MGYDLTFGSGLNDDLLYDWRKSYNLSETAELKDIVAKVNLLVSSVPKLEDSLEISSLEEGKIWPIEESEPADDNEEDLSSEGELALEEWLEPEALELGESCEEEEELSVNLDADAGEDQEEEPSFHEELPVLAVKKRRVDSCQLNRILFLSLAIIIARL